MRKVGQKRSTSEAALLWEVWRAGGNAVITIPSLWARLLAKDAEGKTWVIVKDLASEGFQITLVTQDTLEDLDFFEEQEL